MPWPMDWAVKAIQELQFMETKLQKLTCLMTSQVVLKNKKPVNIKMVIMILVLTLEAKKTPVVDQLKFVN